MAQKGPHHGDGVHLLPRLESSHGSSGYHNMLHHRLRRHCHWLLLRGSRCGSGTGQLACDLGKVVIVGPLVNAQVRFD